jgi:hypothetical protein
MEDGPWRLGIGSLSIFFFAVWTRANNSSGEEKLQKTRIPSCTVSRVLDMPLALALACLQTLVEKMPVEAEAGGCGLAMTNNVQRGLPSRLDGTSN